jgi:phage terminase Nu1 subunit (DNA packaging protein)
MGVMVKKAIDELDAVVTQAEFGRLVGVTQPAVSALMSRGVIRPNGTALEWLNSYITHLVEVAEERGSAGGELDLPQERAALARSQRVAHDLRNQESLSAYAPTEVLEHALCAVREAMVSRFDEAIEGLSRNCPDLPDEALIVVRGVLSSARKEWVRSTSKLIDSEPVEPGPADVEDGDDGAFLDGEG